MIKQFYVFWDHNNLSILNNTIITNLIVCKIFLCIDVKEGSQFLSVAKVILNAGLTFLYKRKKKVWQTDGEAKWEHIIYFL